MDNMPNFSDRTLDPPYKPRTEFEWRIALEAMRSIPDYWVMLYSGKINYDGSIKKDRT